MRILSIDNTPVHEWTYLSASPRGKSELVHFPLLRAAVDALPEDVEALLVMSDLQGVATSASHEGAAALLGEVLAEELALLGDLGELPHPNHVGILLAGDLYSDASATVRGASGDVRSVWLAFAERFRWVAGVAGNHDTFGTPRERERFRQHAGLHLLDGEVRELDDGLRVGGVGGIIGRAGKPERREEADYLEVLRDVLRAHPDVLVLHEGPDEPSTGRRGSPAIRAELEGHGEELLVVCGHSHWDEPLATLPGGARILNVEARAVLLRRA